MRALGFEPRKEEIKKMLRDVEADRNACLTHRYPSCCCYPEFVKDGIAKEFNSTNDSSVFWGGTVPLRYVHCGIWLIVYRSCKNINTKLDSFGPMSEHKLPNTYQKYPNRSAELNCICHIRIRLLRQFLKGRPSKSFSSFISCTVYFSDMHTYDDRVGIQFRKVESGQFPQPHVQQNGGKRHQRRNFKGFRIFCSSFRIYRQVGLFFLYLFNTAPSVARWLHIIGRCFDY